jgi:hypothetical protein
VTPYCDDCECSFTDDEWAAFGGCMFCSGDLDARVCEVSACDALAVSGDPLPLGGWLCRAHADALTEDGGEA